MASSFITINNRTGFWIRDELMELVVHYIIISMDLPPFCDLPWMRRLRKRFERISKGLMYSFISLGLECLTTEEKKDMFFRLLETTKMSFLEKGTEISLAELNEVNHGRDEESKILWRSPYPTAPVVQVLDHLSRLVRGEVATTAADARNFPNS